MYSSKPKISHKTLYNTFEDRGLINVYVKFKIISLPCSWVKILYNDNHHNWKIVPLYFINKYFGKNFIFIQISISIWLWLIVFQSSINKSLLIGVIILFPIPKFHFAFNPIFYGTINIC